MANYKMVDTDQLDSDLTSIAEAIRAKRGTSEKLIFPQGMIQAVEGITSGEGLDTFDATATPTDMAEGVTAYVKGEKITGSVKAYSSQAIANASSVQINNDGYLVMGFNTSTPYLFRKGISLKSPASNFGDAAADNVEKGKTFTSANGLKMTGNVISVGEFVAHKLTDGTVVWDQTQGLIDIYKSIAEPTLLKSGAVVHMLTPLNKFGGATQEDVREGVTFTSQNGYLIKGTLKTNQEASLLSLRGETNGLVAGDIVQAKEINDLILISGYSTTSTIFYSSEVDKDTNENLILSGEVSSTSASSVANLEVIKNKYIQLNSGIYFIPEDAIITQNDQMYDGTYIVSKAKPVFILG